MDREWVEICEINGLRKWFIAFRRSGKNQKRKVGMEEGVGAEMNRVESTERKNDLWIGSEQCPKMHLHKYNALHNTHQYRSNYPIICMADGNFFPPPSILELNCSSLKWEEMEQRILPHTHTHCQQIPGKNTENPTLSNCHSSLREKMRRFSFIAFVFICIIETNWLEKENWIFDWPTLFFLLVCTVHFTVTCWTPHTHTQTCTFPFPI